MEIEALAFYSDRGGLCSHDSNWFRLEINRHDSNMEQHQHCDFRSVTEGLDITIDIGAMDTLRDVTTRLGTKHMQEICQDGRGVSKFGPRDHGIGHIQEYKGIGLCCEDMGASRWHC